MNFYYEINLNFLNKYYNFYEWNEDDSIKLISKIPIFKIDTKSYLKIINSVFKVNNEFIELIKNKTIYNKGIIKYACIFTDSNNAYSVLFNEKGESIFYSSINLDDELNINEIAYSLKKYNLDYNVIKSYKYNNILRNDSVIKEYILKELNILFDNKNITKLKYFYFELFKKENDNIKEILYDIKSLLSSDLNDSIYELYNLIKLSYKNV